MKFTKQSECLLGQHQRGFSMIEMLMAAFVMGIGLMGLTMLQAMSMRGSTNSRMQSLAIGVGQSVLESIDSEGRQQRLFRTLDQADPAPALSAYFNTNQPVAGAYNIYGTVTNPGSADPLERITAFTTSSSCTKNATGATAISGAVYDFQVIVSFTDTISSSNTAIKRTQTFRRKVTL